MDVEELISIIEDAMWNENINVLGRIDEIYLSREDGLVVERGGRRFEIIVKEV